MSNKHSLSIVRRIYSHREKQAEQNVQRLRFQVQQERERLEQLEKFIETTSKSQQHSVCQGYWLVSREQFKQQLELAVSQQQQLLSSCEVNYSKALSIWQNHHNQGLLLDKLLKKKLYEELEALVRSEQKDIDEILLREARLGRDGEDY